MNEIGIDELIARREGLAVLDVRAPHEFDGTLGKPCDPRQGHIPGARNLDVYRLMGMSPEAVHDELGLEPGTEIVAYCHGGGRSAIAAQALRALGYDARNYEGSWHEWSRRDDLPIET